MAVSTQNQNILGNTFDTSANFTSTNNINLLLSDSLFRFQNRDRPGTSLFAGEGESQNIRANYPNFVEEGVAFEVGI